MTYWDISRLITEAVRRGDISRALDLAKRREAFLDPRACRVIQQKEGD